MTSAFLSFPSGRDFLARKYFLNFPPLPFPASAPPLPDFESLDLTSGIFSFGYWEGEGFVILG